MGMIAEFREFAMKGNVVDMAVGVIIGAVFRKDRLQFGRKDLHAHRWRHDGNAGRHR